MPEIPIPQLPSPTRLSLGLILVVGVAVGLLFVFLGVAALSSPGAASLTDWLPGNRYQHPAAYVAINLVFVALIAGTWIRQPKALLDAREHFVRIRTTEHSRRSGV